MQSGATANGTATLAVRIWLADEPGRLGVVAAELGSVGVNVVGMEVLERSGGMVIDELRIETPPRVSADDVARLLGALSGIRVEDVRPLRPGSEERGLEVIRAAEALLEAANATAAVATLVAMAQHLFDHDWSALVDLRSQSCLERRGEVPPTEWLLAFVAGVHSTPGGAETAGCGVIAGSLLESGLVLCIGRTVGFRRRERRELDMLARVADRMCRPIRGDRIPVVWSQRSSPLV